MTRRRLPVSVLAVAVGVAAGLVISLGLVGGRSAGPAGPGLSSGPATTSVRLEESRSPREPPEVRVLRDWDRRRAAAYATSSFTALRAAYVRGSTAGASDVAVLEEYRARGWRVVGLRTQLLAVAVLEHTRDRWRLRVTDRLAAASAVRREHRVPLPRDRASTRLVTLTRPPGGAWQVAAVQPG